jgi:hypothetical protein
LAGTNSPEVVQWDVNTILSDMNLSELPDNTSEVVVDIKAYLEDDEAASFLKGILGMAKNYKTYNGHGSKKRLQVIPIGIGGSNLVQLPKHDPYFNGVMLIVDADTSIPNKVCNALKLPDSSVQGRLGLNPERTIYEYIQELAKGQACEYVETHNFLVRKGVSTDRLENDFLKSDVTISKRESSKSWFKSVFSKIEEYELLSRWAVDHPKKMADFKQSLEQKLHELYLKQI